MKKLLILGALAAGFTLAGTMETAEAGHRYRSYRYYGSDCYDYGYGRYRGYGRRYHHYSGRRYYPRSYRRGFGFSYYKHRHGHHRHRGFNIRTPGFRFGYYK